MLGNLARFAAPVTGTSVTPVTLDRQPFEVRWSMGACKFSTYSRMISRNGGGPAVTNNPFKQTGAGPAVGPAGGSSTDAWNNVGATNTNPGGGPPPGWGTAPAGAGSPTLGPGLGLADQYQVQPQYRNQYTNQYAAARPSTNPFRGL